MTYQDIYSLGPVSGNATPTAATTPTEPMRVKFEWYSDNFNTDAQPIVF